MIPVVAAAVAAPWEAAEVRPLAIGPALAASPAWDGAPAWFGGGPDGLVVLGADGAVVARSDALHPRALLVTELDGTGEPEVVACGPEGLALLRGGRAGLAPPRVLSEAPCDAVVAVALERWPGLATVSDGALVRWTPTPAGLTAAPTGVRVPDPRDLASLGPRVAVIDDAGALRVSAPDERVEGPLAAVAAGPDGFVWVADGAAPRWSGGDPLPDAVTGLVVDGPWTFLLDGPGHRLRATTGGWVSLPVAPERAVVVGEAGCPDLLVADGAGQGALVRGTCAGPAPAVAPAPIPPPAGPPLVPDGAVRAAPAELALRRDGWRVVDVRAGETLSTRVGWGDGRAWKWSSRGGPPGFSVGAAGVMDYEAEEDDVGRWRASIRSRAWPRARWAGVEVRVWPADVTLGPPVAEGEDDPAAVVEPTPRPEVRHGGFRSWVSAGLAGGLAATNGSRWESLGSSPVGGGVSPFAAVTTETRLARGVDLLAGADAAPLYSFPSTPDRRSHVFATTLGLSGGSATVRAGLYGTFGYVVYGVGARVVVTPWVDPRGRATGPELRATWLAPQLGGEAVLAWTWRL